MSSANLTYRGTPTPNSETSTENQVKSTKKGVSKILVVVRSRPLTEKEAVYNSKSLTKIVQNKIVVLQDPTVDENIPEQAFRVNRTKER
jgi:hypothetical protein